MSAMLSIGSYIQKRGVFAAVLVAVLLCSACDAGQKAANTVNSTESAQVSPVVAQVGQFEISDKMLAYRIGIAAAYGTAVNRPAALVALVHDALEYEVAVSVGVVPSTQEMKLFAEHVNRNTKAPEILAAVKQVFGTDIDAYQRIYLSPKIINRSLRSWFSRNAAMHQQQRASIQQAWALVHGNQDFEQVAKTTGLTYKLQEYSDKQQDIPDVMKGHFPEGQASMSASFRKLLDVARPGDVVNTIVENDYSYRIVRLVGKKDGIYKTEEIIVAKASFTEWFNQQAEKIRVQIFDGALKQAVQSTYANISWVKRL